MRNSNILKNNETPTWSYWILAAYFFMEYCRPQDSLIPAISVLRLSGILGILMFVVLIRFGRLFKLIRLPPLHYYLIFTAVLLVNIPFARNNYHAYDKALTYVIFLFTAILPTIVVLWNRRYLEKFIRFWGFVFFVLALIVFKNGGRGAGSFTWDENDAAATLCVGMAVCYYLSSLAETRKAKLLWLFSTLVIMLAIVATSSRGGFLGMIAVLLVMLFFSGRLIKGAFLGVVVAGLGYLSLFALPNGDHYRAEIVSIFDSGDGTRNERLYSWGIAWIMFKDNPIIGVGANNYPYNVAHYEVFHEDYDDNRKSLGGRWAHSLPFTVLPETGLIGTISFSLCIWFYCWRSFRLGLLKTKSDDVPYYRMIFAGMVGYLVSSLFITTLYYPVIWHLMAIFLAIFNGGVSTRCRDATSLSTIQRY